MVFATLRLFPSSKERPQVMEILQSVKDMAALRSGCVGCWLSDADSLHAYIQYIEQWASEDDLYEHVRSDLYRRVLAAMELSRHSPEVHFHFVSSTRGLELIEDVRNAPT
jgi:quinol monooxygenase YgiN